MSGRRTAKALPMAVPAPQYGMSLAKCAALIGALRVDAHTVSGLTVQIVVDAEAREGAPLNLWASSVLGREVRGDVVCLVVRA